MIGAISPNPHLTVKDTHTLRGRGVFAERSFQQGEMLETSAVVEIYAKWNDLPRHVQLIVYDWGYLIGSSDEDLRGIALGVVSLFNHSENPNVSFKANIDLKAIIFTASKDILAGEELLIDYNADQTPGSPNWFSLMKITPAV